MNLRLRTDYVRSMQRFSYLLIIVFIASFFVVGQASAATSIAPEQKAAAKKFFAAIAKADQIYQADKSAAERGESASDKILSQCTQSLQELNQKQNFEQPYRINRAQKQLGAVFSYSVVAGASRDTTSAANAAFDSVLFSGQPVFNDLSNDLRWIYDNYNLKATAWNAAYLTPSDFCSGVSDWLQSDLRQSTIPMPIASNYIVAETIADKSHYVSFKKTLNKWAKILKIKQFNPDAFLRGYGPNVNDLSDNIEGATNRVAVYLSGSVIDIRVNQSDVIFNNEGAMVKANILILDDGEADLKMDISARPTKTQKRWSEVCSQSKKINAAGIHQLQCLVPNRYLSKKRSKKFNIDIDYTGKRSAGFGYIDFAIGPR